MTVYYYQGAPIIQPVAIETEEILFVNDTLSMKQDRLKGAGQRWSVSFGVLPTGSMTTFASLMYAVDTVQVFNFPQVAPNLTAITITTSGASSINTTTFTTSGASSLSIGRMIKFNNHSKLYMVTGISGTTVTVYPRLRSNIPSAHSILAGSNVPFSAYLDPTVIRGVTFNEGLLEDYGSLRFIEAV